MSSDLDMRLWECERRIVRVGESIDRQIIRLSAVGQGARTLRWYGGAVVGGQRQPANMRVRLLGYNATPRGAGVTVQVWDSNTTAMLASGTTDADGRASFNMPTGTAYRFKVPATTKYAERTSDGVFAPYDGSLQTYARQVNGWYYISGCSEPQYMLNGSIEFADGTTATLSNLTIGTIEHTRGSGVQHWYTATGGITLGAETNGTMKPTWTMTYNGSTNSTAGAFLLGCTYRRIRTLALALVTNVVHFEADGVDPESATHTTGNTSATSGASSTTACDVPVLDWTLTGALGDVSGGSATFTGATPP
jgi:hypothetical protein